MSDEYGDKTDEKSDDMGQKGMNYAEDLEKELSINELNQIVLDFDRAISDSGWLNSAEESWAEYKRTSNKTKRFQTKKRFPLWFATGKVRQPLVFSKVPDVVVNTLIEDQAGFNTMTANVGEKFAHAVIEMFPFYSVAVSARDDVLMTSLGTGRVMFDAEFVTKPKKIPVVVQQIQAQDPQTGQVFPQDVFIGPNGQQVDPGLVKLDMNQEPYIESDEMEERVQQERVFMKPVSYKEFGWDYSAKEFSEWEFVFYRYKWTKRQIVQRFGKEALAHLNYDLQKTDRGAERRRKCEIIELEHRPTRRRYIFELSGKGVIKTIEEKGDEPEESGEMSQSLNTQNFFSCPYPLFDNLCTEDSIPFTEYSQVRDILEQIHDLYERKTQCTRLARPRALYDSLIQELSSLISKAKQGTYIGVPGLASKVRQGQALILYLDVTPVINAMKEFAAQIEQELNGYDQITQFSEVVRGVTNPYESATATERKSQFSLSRIKPLQQDMQRWCRDSIRLLVDVALEKFSEERCYEILEASLSPEEKEAFPRIIKKLKSDDWRSFSLDIETDSTVLIDEDSQKQRAMELGKVIGEFLGQVARAAATAPETVELSALVMEEVIDKFRGSKKFKTSIKKSFQAIMQASTQRAQQSQANSAEMMKAKKDQAELQLKAQKLSLEQFEAQNRAAVDKAKLQLGQLKFQLDAIAQNKKLSIEERQQAIDEFVKKANVEMDQVYKSLDIQEKFMEERRLSEQQLNQEPNVVMLQPIVQQKHHVSVVPTDPSLLFPEDNGALQGLL